MSPRLLGMLGNTQKNPRLPKHSTPQPILNTPLAAYEKPFVHLDGGNPPEHITTCETNRLHVQANTGFLRDLTCCRQCLDPKPSNFSHFQASRRLCHSSTKAGVSARDCNRLPYEKAVELMYRGRNQYSSCPALPSEVQLLPLDS